MNNKAHAVTGAFGFTGSYIAKKLLANGHRVVTLTNSLKRESALQGSIEARPYSFDDFDKLVESLQDVEVLYNTYWVRFNYGQSTHEQALENSKILFQAAKKAGVSRIVHISIANASVDSPFSYFRCKALAELALEQTGLSYAILRPAALFGQGGILINNIAWALRRMPVFAVFGSGNYHIQPIHVDDLAALAVDWGQKDSNAKVAAIGPDLFTYRELVNTIGESIGYKRPIMRLPAFLGYFSAWLIGLVMRDVFATKDEIDGLMADLLQAKGNPPTGQISLKIWAKEHKDTLGVYYSSELARRRDTTKAYW